MNKNIVVFALVMLVLGTVATSSAPSAFADWLIDRSGTLVQIDGAILGDDDTADEVEAESENENEVENDAKPSETVKREMEKQREAGKQRLEKSREQLKKQTEIRQKTQVKTGQKSEFELETEGNKIKLKQEIRDTSGKVIRKSETKIEDGVLHVEQEDGEVVEINAIGDRAQILRNKIKTNSEFKLNVGEKNAISVTLPNGKVREVALPDQALEKLVANGVITAKGGEENAYELTAGKNGEPVYEVEGQVEKKLFGLFKLKFSQKMAVAAGASEDGSVEAGDVVETESRETGWRRLWERLAI